MVKHIDQEIRHYYDLYLTEEDLVSESTIHRQLVIYLGLVLKWLFRGQICALCGNLNFYQTDLWEEYPLAPDIALIKGVEQQEVSSWNIGTTGPAPQVVFEIASKKTWNKDLDEKPSRYALIGVEEYFAYDPHTPLFREGTTNRLYGWQLDKATGLMRAMTLDADGCLWSQELESFLVPDGQYLRLYDRNGHLRLTGEEAEAQARLVETRRADAATRRADAEAQARLAETRRADAEAKARQVLAEKLRSLGIDPNQL